VVAAGLIVMLALVACRPAATPVGQPTMACGGFHLKVVNGLSESVRLNIGTDWTDVIEAGKTEMVVQYFMQPKPPPLPWLVEIYDSTGRVTLFRQTMDGAADQKVTLAETSAAQSPLSRQDGGCSAPA
jgi:hypothetical protein